MKRIASCFLAFWISFFPFHLKLSAKEGSEKIYCRNAACQSKVALTFDDGPHPRYTEEILDILAEYHVTATFFIIGINAINYPEDLQKIVASGCEIGNHTESHRHLRELSEEKIRWELSECENTIEKLCGIRPSIFRPPEGMMNDTLKCVAKELGYSVVLWSIDTKDWALNPPNQIFKTVKNQVRGGDIILMHDYVSGGNTTCQALRLLIPELLSRGYEFVTVSELIKEDHG